MASRSLSEPRIGVVTSITALNLLTDEVRVIAWGMLFSAYTPRGTYDVGSRVHVRIPLDLIGPAEIA